MARSPTVFGGTPFLVCHWLMSKRLVKGDIRRHSGSSTRKTSLAELHGELDAAFADGRLGAGRIRFRR